MSKKILLIESDPAFANQMATAIEARGLAARVVGDGREGLELARAERPDAVVLCVELPRMSGYSVCQKFKKDDALREIPLVLMSAEATQETFEQHRKLKARADDYILKPFEPARLMDVIGALVELPPAEAVDAADDVVTLDDVEDLDALSVEVPESAEDLHTEIAALPPGDDEDLKLLDEAFDSLATHEDPAPAALDALEAPLDAPTEPARDDELAAAEAALAALDEPDAAHSEDGGAAGAAIDAAWADVETPSPARGAPSLVLVPPPPPPALDAEAPADAAVEPAAEAPSAEVQALQDRVSELLIDISRTEEELQNALAELSQAHAFADAAARDATERATADAGRLAEAEEALRAAREDSDRARAEAAQEAQARADADVRAREAEARAEAAEVQARDAAESARASDERARAAEERASADAAAAEAAEARARDAEGRAGEAERTAAELRDRLAEVERALAARDGEVAEARARGDALSQELEQARGDVAEACAQADASRKDGDRQAEELARRVSELEAQNARHEERVVKAYQKMKGDEKVREKTRKALAIALQLLEDRAPGAPAPDVQPRRE